MQGAILKTIRASYTPEWALAVGCGERMVGGGAGWVAVEAGRWVALAGLETLS